MKQLDRVLFLQGRRCFFCNDVLDRQHASIEHLNAVANGGANVDSNCVACCKAVNSALGSLSIKEKVQVFLNQESLFVCPAKSDSIEQAIPEAELIVNGEFAPIATPPRLVAPDKPLRITNPAATKVEVTKKVAVAEVGSAKKATAAKKAVTPKKVAASKKVTTPKKATAAKKVANTSAPVAGPIVAVADLAIVLKQLQATKCPPATEPNTCVTQELPSEFLF